MWVYDAYGLAFAPYLAEACYDDLEKRCPALVHFLTDIKAYLAHPVWHAVHARGD